MFYVHRVDKTNPRRAMSIFNRFMKTTQPAALFVEGRHINDESDIDCWMLQFVSRGQLFDYFFSDIRLVEKGNVAHTRYVLERSSLAASLAHLPAASEPYAPAPSH